MRLPVSWLKDSLHTGLKNTVSVATSLLQGWKQFTF